MILRASQGILAEPSSTTPFYQVISEMQQKFGIKMLDIDDIISRDDADELADFMSRAVCSCSLSNSRQQAIVRFRNHVIEISAHSAPAVKIDGVDLDVSSHPAITNLLISLIQPYQPAQSA